MNNIVRKRIYTISCSCLFLLMMSLTNPINSEEIITQDTDSDVIESNDEFDPIVAQENQEEIASYIDDLSRWVYVERVLDRYDTIDMAIDDKSFSLLHRVLANNPLLNPNIVASAERTQRDLEILDHAIEFLLSKKVDINLLNGDGQSALTVVASSINSQTHPLYMNHILTIIKLLIDNGADVNTRTVSELPLLHHLLICDYRISSIRSENKNIVLYLLEKGADVNILDNTGKNAIMYASEYCNDFIMFKSICDKTQDINYNIDVRNGKKNALNFVLDQLTRNRTSKDKNLVKEKILYLFSKEIQLIENSNEGFITLLIRNHMNLSENYDRDLIMIVKLFVESGADINKTYSHHPPLYELIYRLRIADEVLLEYLVDNGAEINFVRNNKTVLDLVIASNSDKARRIESFLRSKGAMTHAELSQ